MTDKMLNWAILGTLVIAEAAIVFITNHYMKKVSKELEED